MVVFKTILNDDPSLTIVDDDRSLTNLNDNLSLTIVNEERKFRPKGHLYLWLSSF